MPIRKSFFGTAMNGEPVHLYTLTNKNSLCLEITNLGGRLVRLFLPDKNNQFADVIMGFDRIESYLIRNPYFGALVGRFANRISHAKFDLNGVTYQLDVNAGVHHLHGGQGGFDKLVWDASTIVEEEQEKLLLKLKSKDNEDGYPGNLDVAVKYALTDKNELIIEYDAVSDKDTYVNLTNHNYFNLAGHSSGSIHNHFIEMKASHYTPTDEFGMPTGETAPVEGTPIDLRKKTRMGDRIHSLFPQIIKNEGFDLNYILDKTEEFQSVCKVWEPDSGRTMEVFTTKPAMQFYTGNNIKNSFVFVGKQGYLYTQHCGFCLETQYNPNSPNISTFPDVVLKAGEEYKHKTVYAFGVE
ncbi:aldose 1-/glucose-6-phosphate 1-epimerase [Lucifera butyrica]|uniref:Aldose 1-epimerase n=1 Tax=Lucifera butyrica TaxID=1351585 RepID=A0A498R8M7_9FIRM|nr:aldose epimerase family protein [Lucifera butyrica]VBB07741.1 aldose 1-/glucose-6-phosphate 1-epimerase [Lucifera butyrica]